MIIIPTIKLNIATQNPYASRRPVRFHYLGADWVWGDKDEAVQFMQLKTKCARQQDSLSLHHIAQ